MAYSPDLRQKVVEAYCIKKLGSTRELAEIFSVSESTIKRWIYRYRKEGHVKKRPHGGGKPPLLNEEELKLLYELQLEYPDATLSEISFKLDKLIGKKASASTLSRELIKLRLSRKKNIPCSATGTRKSSES